MQNTVCVETSSIKDDAVVALVMLNPYFRVTYFFQCLSNATDCSAAKCTDMCIQALNDIYVSRVKGLLSVGVIPLLLSLHWKLYVYSESMTLACCGKEASGFQHLQAYSAVWTPSYFRANKRVCWVFLSSGETCTFSTVFLHRRGLFLTSCSFDIPNALTNIDT